MNPEYGVFGVAKDTNEDTNPTALDVDRAGHRGDLHQRRLQREDPRGLVGGQDPEPARADVDGWLDWKGEPIADRSEAEQDDPWAHPNSRFTTTLANVPNIAPDFDDAAGRADRRASSSAAAPATASRWSARSPTSPRASTTA